ncbi:Beta-1,3-glucan-binding protein [Holothuria leucospilota]|uniref:Beta-1,3-glucan-binding protein n=1 Tax=Holothuria leucospilota TaxID=206669 RepID=A0A9Q0YN77_HOLLE|nr:Beta-1,3-glucan-binding protein [Holothuria leucospilota]
MVAMAWQLSEQSNTGFMMPLGCFNQFIVQLRSMSTTVTIVISKFNAITPISCVRDAPASSKLQRNEDLKNPSETYVGIQQMGQTLHWGPYLPLNGSPKTHVTKNLPDDEKFSDAYHQYGLEWTADSLIFYLDDEETMTVDPGDQGFWEYGRFGYRLGIDNPWANSPNKLAPFDQEFYIIINVAVGGIRYFADNLTNKPYPKPWLNNSTHPIKDFYDAKDYWHPTWNAEVNNGEDAALKVRSVRVWAV